MTKSRLLFFSLEPWDEVWRRNQFFAREMSSDYEVVFIQPVISVFKLLFRINKQDWYQGIRIVPMYKLVPEQFSFFRWINRRFYLLQIKLRKLDKTDVIWNNDHLLSFVLKHIKYNTSVYDITDDWTMLPLPRWLKERVISGDKELCELSDVVIVCSEVLYKAKTSYKSNLHLVKNGVDIEEKTNTKVALNFKGLVLMYSGSLHQERLDVSLIVELAREFKEDSFVFVGPDYLDKKSRELLISEKNIHLLGTVPYSQIWSYYNSVDVLIVPHAINQFTESLNPIKQYEYLLTDKPVIATAVSGFRELSDVFEIAENISEFVNKIREIKNGEIKVDIKERRLYANQNSWKDRYQKIKGLINLFNI